MTGNIYNIIMRSLNCMPEDISSIEMLSKGMTNHSYRFLSKGQWYIIRIPGEGTERLINRKQEADVYTAIKDTGLCDSPIYFDGTTGVKISKHLEGVRTCDPFCDEDVEKCVDLLRKLHDCRLKVSHRFDIFERIKENFQILVVINALCFVCHANCAIFAVASKLVSKLGIAKL